MGALLTWYNGLKGGPDPSTPSHSMSLAKAAGHATLAAGVSMGLGWGLGLIASNMKSGGPDFKVGGMNIPVDLVGGIATSVAAAKMAGSPLGAYLRTASDTQFGIFGYRHGVALGAARMGTGAQVMAHTADKIKAAGEDAGSSGHNGETEDPVIAFARARAAQPTG